jgi:fumarate reductase (CoM/CoB) subunit A
MATRDQTSWAIFRELQEGRGVDGGVYLDLSPVDSKLFDSKYRHLADAMRRAGKELGKDPIVITPVAHHSMGGIVVNESLESDVRGLFAAGEACGGTHGANRLAGNAFTECIVFGAIAGEAAAIYAGSHEIHADLPDGDLYAAIACNHFDEKGPAVADLKRELKKWMWEKGGIARTGDGLQAARREVAQTRELLSRGKIQQPAHLIHFYELENMVEVAEAVLRSALVREESRGAHFREDFPEQNDAGWLGTVFARENEEKVLDVWFEERA